MSMKKSNDTIGNRTRDLPACSAVPLNELCAPKVSKSRGFTQKHRTSKLLPTWYLTDVLPRLMVLDALTAPIHSSCFPSYVIYNQKSPFLIDWRKGIYLNEACSGFEPESPVGNSIFNVFRMTYGRKRINSSKWLMDVKETHWAFYEVVRVFRKLFKTLSGSKG